VSEWAPSSAALTDYERRGYLYIHVTSRTDDISITLLPFFCRQELFLAGDVIRQSREVNSSFLSAPISCYREVDERPSAAASGWVIRADYTMHKALNLDVTP